MNTQSSQPSSDPVAGQPAGTPPAALNDLIAAGLVSHELIGDPVHIGAEATALAKLCGMIAGPIYRIDPFHYAFRAGPGDLSGRLGDLAPADWTAALDEAMGGAFGAEAIWLNATDLLTGEEAPLDHPLLLLRAHAAAVTEATPGLQAVINARYATETAQLTARLSGAAETGSVLAGRLAEIEQRQREILRRLAEPAEADPASGRLPNGLAETLAVISRRLDSQSGTLTAHTVRVEGIAATLNAMSQRLEGQAETGRTSAGHIDGLTEVLATISQRLDAQAGTGQAGAARVESIAGTLTAISQRLNTQAENSHIRAVRVEQVLETLAAISQRLDAQAVALDSHMARADGLAERLAELSGQSGGPAVFQETLGLTLAEFLARLEYQAAQTTTARAPRLS